jgi:branched-chain amino acid transport system substrate-binding protein
VQYVVGMFGSDVCNAVGPITQQLNILYAGHCNDPSLLRPDGPKNFYMAATITNAYPLGVVNTVERRFPDIKTWDIFSLDYVTGQTMATLVERAVLGSGAQVGAKVFAPLTATDVSPYINSLLSRGPDRNRGLIAFALGAPGASLYKQGALAGLFARYGAVVPVTLVESTLDAVGSTLPRQFTQHDYCPCVPRTNKLYRDLAAIWQRQFDHGPSATGLVAVGAVQAFAGAMQKAKSTNPARVKRAMQGLKFQSIKGQIVVNRRYFVQPMVAFQCEGDSSAQRGWRCAQNSIHDARQITPREFLPPVR